MTKEIRTYLYCLLLGAIMGFVIYDRFMKAPPPQPQVVEKVVYKDRTVVKYKTKELKRTIVKPDGTTIVEEAKATDSTNIAEKESTQVKTIFKTERTNYSLGLVNRYRWDSEYNPKELSNYGLSVSRRLLGELWVQGVAFPSPKDREVMVGLYYNF